MTQLKIDWNPPSQASWLEGSLDLANRTAPQESGSEKMTNATYGQRCLEQFERFSHVGLWAKMFSALLIGTGGWYSRRCKLTWKLKGTKYSRLYFQLRPSTLPTDASGFGLLLKTPCSADAYTEGMSKKEQKFGNSGTLAQEVQTGFIYQRGLLPTPKAQEARRNASKDRGKFNLTDEIAARYQPTSKSSQLNPRFVAEMMGFPPNWTELPFLNGETNPSKPTETQ